MRLGRLIALAALPILAIAGCAQQGPVREDTDTGTSPAMINVRLGVGYMREGKNDFALAKLKRALDQNPNLAVAHNVIAVLYERLGETELADEHYRRALSLAPDDASTQNNFGQFLCKQGRLKEADELFLKAAANPLYKTPERPFTNAGLCARRVPDLAKAESYLRSALRVNPRYAPALLAMAHLSYETEEYLSARGYLQRYLAVAPHSAETLWLGIRTERELGGADAVSSYSLLLKGKFPDSEETRLLLESERHERRNSD